MLVQSFTEHGEPPLNPKYGSLTRHVRQQTKKVDFAVEIIAFHPSTTGATAVKSEKQSRRSHIITGETN